MFLLLNLYKDSQHFSSVNTPRQGTLLLCNNLAKGTKPEPSQIKQVPSSVISDPRVADQGKLCILQLLMNIGIKSAFSQSKKQGNSKFNMNKKIQDDGNVYLMGASKKSRKFIYE